MFGGCDCNMPAGPTNDVYVLRMTQGDFTWSKPEVTGKSPPPRWRHTATVFDKTWILYFGGFHSSANRFNDVWVLDTVSLAWSQPVAVQSDFTPRGNHIATRNSNPSVPSPRGAHSASLIGVEVYIFGGYGGTGYGRRDFNDLHSLNLETMSWARHQCKGELPEPRSGHTASVVGNMIYVYGGWNSVQQFNDLFFVDTDTRTWFSADASWGPPRWNHSACSVEAIPNWKLFIFGGASGNLQETQRAQV